MRTILTILLAAPLAAQTIYKWDDHACLTASNATRATRGANANSGGLTITCATGAHGFQSMRSTADVRLGSAIADGDSVTFGGETYTFRDTIASSRDIRRWTTSDGITATEAESRMVAGLIAAINGEDTGVVYYATGDRWVRVTGMSGTYYHASTPTSSKVEAWNRYKVNSLRNLVGIRSKTAGTAGRETISFSSSAIKFFLYYNSTEPSYFTIPSGGTMEVWWYVGISGSSGSSTTGWARVGQAVSGDQPFSAAKVAVLVDDDEFRLPAIDSSGFPDDWASTQQANWRIRRLVADASGNAFQAFEQSDEILGSVVEEEGAIRVDIPNCTTSSTPLECAGAFWSVQNQKAYMRYVNISPTISVASEVITVTFSGSWTSAGGGYTTEAVGVRGQLQGFHKYYDTKTVSSVADNGSGIARVTTSTAHACVNGTDSAYIDFNGTYSDQTYTISVISTTTVDLTGISFAGTATGTLTCNPHGRQANNALRYISTVTPISKDNTASLKILTIDGSGMTLDATGTGIPDGSYTGTCVSKCVGGAHSSAPFFGIMSVAQLYANTKGFRNDSGSGSDTTTYPGSKYWMHAKESIPFDTPPTMARWWVKMTGKNLKRRSDGSGNYFHSGTYVNVTPYESGGSSTATSGYNLGHFYNFAPANIYDGAWMLVEDVAPVGSEGANTFREMPVNLGMGEYVMVNDKVPNPSVRETGLNVPYMANLGSGYFTFPYSDAMVDDSGASDPNSRYMGTSLRIGRTEFAVDTSNVFGWIRNRTCVYASARYATGGVGHNNAPSLGAGYECSWTSKPDTPAPQFEARWSTSATSIRSAGWSTATSTGMSCSDGGDGNSTPCGMDTVIGTPNAYLQLDRATQDAHFWLALRPIIPIQGASANGENTIVQFTIEADGEAFQVGDAVSMAGAGIRSDGAYTIAEILPRRTFFTYAPDANGTVGAWNDAGEIASIVCNGTICTVEFNSAHGLVSGMTIMVAGTNNTTVGGTPGSKFSTAKNYTATVVDSDTITFPSSVTATLSNQATCPGTPSGCIPMKIHVYPGWRLTGTNTGSWTGSGTIKSTEDNRGFAEIYYPSYSEAPASPPTITTTTLPDGTVGAAYSQTVAATGGTTPYTFTILSGSLPAGLSLATSGAITGTPTTAGLASFTVRVTDDAAMIDDQALTITIAAAPAGRSATMTGRISGRIQ